MYDHFFESSNIYLRNAIAKYGIGAFEFIVVEFVEIIADTSPSEIKALLLSREQIYLNWLFSLPASCRFNFLSVAGSGLGYQHTPEAKAAISAANQGENNPNWGKRHSDSTVAAMSAAKAGENNPMYGVLTSRAQGVSVFSAADNSLLFTFPSYREAARYLNISHSAISKAVRSGEVYKGLYVFKKG